MCRRRSDERTVIERHVNHLTRQVDDLLDVSRIACLSSTFRAEMLAEALKTRGYKTGIAYDAPTALELAGTFTPDVAFGDIGLPVWTGTSSPPVCGRCRACRTSGSSR